MEEKIKKYLYLLDIIPEDKEIIIMKCEKLLWTMIPFTAEMLEAVLDYYPDYEVYELDEGFMRWQADRVQYMNPN